RRRIAARGGRRRHGGADGRGVSEAVVELPSPESATSQRREPLLEKAALGSRASELDGAAIRSARGAENRIVIETVISDEAPERAQPGARTVGSPDRDRALQGDDRGWREREQLIIERDDLRPIGRLVGRRERVARRNRGLEMKR